MSIGRFTVYTAAFMMMSYVTGDYIMYNLSYFELQPKYLCAEDGINFTPCDPLDSFCVKGNSKIFESVLSDCHFL
jgi:hypothetical protein